MSDQKKQFNILVFHRTGFSYGSTEKLMRQMSKILSQSFKVFFVAGGLVNETEKKALEALGITVISVSSKKQQDREPYKLLNMEPPIKEIIKKYNITCIFTDVFAHYQFPINSVPASIPFVLISPFGHFTTNGNVALAYVSGKINTQRVINRGAKAKILFNPLEDFSQTVWQKPAVGERIVFGRIGRDDDAIFDPIALRAFKKLEEIYPNEVKYIVVNPPPMWKKMAVELGVRNMETRPPILDREGLCNFYKEIDVLAHARKDGETVGMAIAEAMLAGNPILTHKSHFHNEHFEILNPAYALWAEVGDVEKYFENMEWMVKNKNKIRSMGLLARQKALEIFSLETQTPKILADFKAACQKNYNDTPWGRIKGYIRLYLENFKALPFLIGKNLTYHFPYFYKTLRKFYYK